jgi:hypothetical protein
VSANVQIVLLQLAPLDSRQLLNGRTHVNRPGWWLLTSGSLQPATGRARESLVCSGAVQIPDAQETVLSRLLQGFSAGTQATRDASVFSATNAILRTRPVRNQSLQSR